MPELVIGVAALLVGEHFVSLGCFLELLFGLRIVGVHIRMEFTGHLAESLLDLGVSGLAGDPEGFVVVAFVAHAS